MGILICGLNGSGKSTLGKALADRMGYEFIDNEDLYFPKADPSYAFCSTLGICAERNAIFNMITNGEQEILKVIAILPDGSSGAPCGACRELM